MPFYFKVNPPVKLFGFVLNVDFERKKAFVEWKTSKIKWYQLAEMRMQKIR